MSNEFEFEPVPGLPEELPEGETLLWQGSPRWTAMARRALHATAAAVYIGAVVAWVSISGMLDGSGLHAVAQAASRILLAGASGIALLCLIAWFIARTTIYSITSQRIVMRFGIALPMVVNIPFGEIASVDAKLERDGSGDIAIRTTGSTRLGFVPLWPHVRAWCFKNPQPLLRGLPNAQQAAQVLAQALATKYGTSPKRIATPVTAPVPSRPSPVSGASVSAA